MGSVHSEKSPTMCLVLAALEYTALARPLRDTGPMEGRVSDENGRKEASHMQLASKRGTDMHLLKSLGKGSATEVTTLSAETSNPKPNP